MKLKNIIQNILNEEVSKILNEDFKSQRNNFISQINSPNAEAIVDRYLNDFREIKDKKYSVAANAELDGLNVKKGNDRFDIDKYKTFKELEILVDYVSGQVNVGSANFEDIKVDGKPIYEDKEVEIYYADTPRACIQYNGNYNYSWCVSRTDASNMFYNYRLGENEPAFYFVKRKRAINKEFNIWNFLSKVFTGDWDNKYHFFVIQVIKGSDINNKTDKQYVVTSAKNDGDVEMSWNTILKIAPELKKLQYIFTPKPLTEKEREKIDKYSEGLSDEEFFKLPYIEKEYYISVYVKSDKKLSNNQFKNLPEDLKNKYVGLGVGLSDGQFDMIKNTKLLKRYAEITKRKFEEFFKSERPSQFIFQSSEFNFLDNEKLNTFKINNEHIGPLLKNNPNREFIANNIIELIGNKLNTKGINSLTYYLSKNDEIINKIIELKGTELDPYNINQLLYHALNKDKIINKIVELKGDELDPYNVEHILEYSSNKDEMIDRIINLKANKLDSKDIRYLIEYSSNKKLVINRIIEIKGDKLVSSDMWYLLQHSSNKDLMVDRLIKIKGNKMDSYDIKFLLDSSSDKEKTKNLLIQAGVDRRLIPNQ